VSEPEHADEVGQLVTLGFSAEVAQAALVEHGWDVGQAANSLLG